MTTPASQPKSSAPVDARDGSEQGDEHEPEEPEQVETSKTGPGRGRDKKRAQPKV